MATPTLKKTCTICGLSKPLSAFLELGGPDGTFYGTVCSDCRKAGLDKVKSHETEDGTTRRSTESIKPEHRLHAEITKKEQHEESEEEYKQDREKHELLKTKKLQKIKTIATKEKQHREDFLKKSAFLDSSKNTDKQKAAESKYKGEITDKKIATKYAEKLNTIDMSVPYTPPQTAEIKRQYSSIFNQFKDWLGTAAGAYVNQNLNAPDITGKNANKNSMATKDTNKNLKTSPATENKSTDKLNTPKSENKNDNKNQITENKTADNKTVNAPTLPENKIDNKNLNPPLDKLENKELNKNLNAFNPQLYKDTNRNPNAFNAPKEKINPAKNVDKTDLSDYVKKTWGPKRGS